MAQVLAEAEKVKALDWSHLAGLPESQFVLSRIGHGDPLVATVRQRQVLTKLHELLADDPLFAPGELGSLPRMSDVNYSGRSVMDDLCQCLGLWVTSCSCCMWVFFR